MEVIRDTNRFVRYNRNKSGGMDINDLELIIQKKRGSLTPEQIAAIGEALS